MSLDLTKIPPYGHFASINGIQMYYEVYGEGTPLILLHGFTQTSLAWQSCIGEFAKYFQVIVPDLRGHGRTINPMKQFTFAQQALDAFALLDTLGIETFKAIGLSGGGSSLQYMATQQPERLESIILEGCAAYFPKHTASILLAMADVDDEALAQQQSQHIQGISQIRALLNQMSTIIDDYNTQPPDLSKITAQTLIINGDRDELISISMLIEMYTAITNAHLCIVPNGNHRSFISDLGVHADMYSQIALEFLQDKW